MKTKQCSNNSSENIARLHLEDSYMCFRHLKKPHLFEASASDISFLGIMFINFLTCKLTYSLDALPDAH